MMRILLDLQGAQGESRLRGIGRYSLSLALSVARNARGHDVHLLVNGAFPEGIDHIREAFAGLLPRRASTCCTFRCPLPSVKARIRFAGSRLKSCVRRRLRRCSRISCMSPAF